MAVGLLIKVREIFNLAQNGLVTSSRLCEQMASLQAESTDEQFWDAFIHHVQKSVIYFKNEPAVDRVVDFIANFATYATRLKNTETGKFDKGEESTDIFTPSGGSDEEEELMEPFLLDCFNFFITHHNAREKGVRLRCCQLVNKLLNLLGDEAAIDEELSDSIYNCMIIRIKDTFPPIRVQAVFALARLQDPSDPECPIIDAYLSSLSRDAHHLVRKSILSNLTLSKKTLPFVIERTRDIKDINRKAAFLILSEKVSIRALSIAQRNKLLIDGLKNERSEEVKRACGEMLKAWFRSCGYNFVQLLEALDTESALECSTIAVETLLNDASLEKLEVYAKQLDGFICSEKLFSPEEVHFWFSICKHLKTCDGGDDLLQRVLPELTQFTQFIRGYSEKNFMDSVYDGNGPSEFILEHLLDIAGLLDLSDEMGRKSLSNLVHDLLVLPTIPISLLSILVKRCKDLERNEDTFIKVVVETISDIKQPLVQVVSTAMKEKTRMLQLQIARISVSIEECKEDLECAVKQQDFLQASILKDNIGELEKQKADVNMQLQECQEEITERVECGNDPATLLKCLTIGTEMLSLVLKRSINPILMTLKDELFLEGVKNEDPYIRNEAIKGLGLLSFLKKEFAAQHLVFFLQVVQVDQEFVKITAIKIIFDLFLMYGVATFNAETNADATSKSENTLTAGDDTYVDEDTIIAETPPENQGENDDIVTTNAAESVLSVLLLFLQNECSDLRTIVAEGLAKVMITGRVVSAGILTRLIILWYNPITEDDLQLRHCLGVFLPAFAFQSKKNQEIVEESFLPTIRVIINAPATSPLTHIDISNVIDLFIQLTDVRNLQKVRSKKGIQESYDSHIHDSIALTLSNEILSDTDGPDVKIFCKALNQLTICSQNTLVINDLIELSRQMIEALEKNRTAKNMIEKFMQHLREITKNVTVDDMSASLSDTVVLAEIMNSTKSAGDMDTSKPTGDLITTKSAGDLNNTKDILDGIKSKDVLNATKLKEKLDEDNLKKEVNAAKSKHVDAIKLKKDMKNKSNEDPETSKLNDSEGEEHNDTVIAVSPPSRKTRLTRSSKASVSKGPSRKVKKVSKV